MGEVDLINISRVDPSLSFFNSLNEFLPTERRRTPRFGYRVSGGVRCVQSRGNGRREHFLQLLALLEFVLPGAQLFTGRLRSSRPVVLQAGRDDPSVMGFMIEHHDAIVKAHDAIMNLKIVGRATGQPGFDKVLEIISPVAERPSKREGEVQFIEQLIA